MALNKHSFAALLVLRSLQSIGGLVVMSLAYAVVADVSVLAEREKILDLMLATTNFKPCFGPVIGGSIVDTNVSYYKKIIVRRGRTVSRPKAAYGRTTEWQKHTTAGIR
jgi:MFS family permease